MIKNRTFWFMDYQGTRIRSGNIPYTGTVPVTQMKNGDFSSILGTGLGTDALGTVVQGEIFDINTTRQLANGTWVRDPFPGNIIPASRFDPAAKKMVDLFPAPNQNLGTRLPGNNYFTNTSQQSNNDQGDIRIDQRLTDKDSLFGTFSWGETQRNTSCPLPGALDGCGFNAANENDKPRSAMLSYARVWTPNFLTETRLAFTRMVTARTQDNPSVDTFAQFGIGGYHPITGYNLDGGLPNTTIQGYSSVGVADYIPTQEYSNVWDFVQNVAFNKGKHALKFGVEYRPVAYPFFQFAYPHGDITFNRDRNYDPNPTFQGNTGDGLAALLLGYPTQGSVSTTNFVSDQKRTYAFYGQSDWKVSSKLTVNLGVRYELFSPTYEKFGRQARFDFDTNTLIIPKGPSQDTPLPPNFSTVFPTVKVQRGVADKYLSPWDKADFGPRIGVAYSLQRKTVVRAGYGIFYGGEENVGAGSNLGASSAPFNLNINLTQPANLSTFQINPLIPTLSQGFPLNVFQQPTGTKLIGEAYHLRTPLVHKWNLAIQRELRGNMAWEVSYIGNHQAHQMMYWDPNTAPARPDVSFGSVAADSLRPVPAYSTTREMDTNSYGNYAALSTKLEKRYSNGLEFLVSYTWGHALSNSGTALYPGIGDTRGNPRDLSQQYTDAVWDIRHNATASLVYDLPFGKGRRFGASASRAANTLIGGWQANSVISVHTGRPFTLETRYGVGYVGTIHPDIVPGMDPNAAPANGRSPDLWFNTSAVTTPKANTVGTSPNASNIGPGVRNVDLSLFKNFTITERYRLQFRAEAMNVSNTPQFANPDATQGDSTFGQISAASGQRNVQFALRFMF